MFSESGELALTTCFYFKSFIIPYRSRPERPPGLPEAECFFWPVDVFSGRPEKTLGIFRIIFPNQEIAKIPSGGKVFFLAGRQKCFFWPARKTVSYSDHSGNIFAIYIIFQLVFIIFHQFRNIIIMFRQISMMIPVRSRRAPNVVPDIQLRSGKLAVRHGKVPVRQRLLFAKFRPILR